MMHEPELSRFHACCLLVRKNRFDVRRPPSVDQGFILLLGRQLRYVSTAFSNDTCHYCPLDLLLHELVEVLHFWISRQHGFDGL